MSRADVSQMAQRRFARLDANKDGFVTEAEAQAVAGQRSQRMQQRAAKMAQRFAKRAQQRDPAAMFARLDDNRDGQVTRAEAEAARTAVAARTDGRPVKARAVARGGMFERGDASRDGTISRAEFDSVRAMRGQRMAALGAKRAGGSAGRMFAMGDANKDGRMTLQEATAMSLQHFDSADANRDGTVTPDERRQMRQQKRAAKPQG
jgi:Ca2+-binding EF-hand superfamily protein